MQAIGVKKLKFRSECPISSALDLVGDKWSLLILRDMIFFQKKTFGSLAKSDEKIATNILSERLKRLEEMDIISKSIRQENRKTKIYSLTEKGIDFIPVIAEYILWSDKHLHDHIAEVARQFAKLLRKNKTAVLEETRNRLLKAVGRQIP